MTHVSPEPVAMTYGNVPAEIPYDHVEISFSDADTLQEATILHAHTITVHEGTVRVHGNASTPIYVNADGDATVFAYGNVVVNAKDNSSVYAYNNAYVIAEDTATAEMFVAGTLIAHGNAEGYLHDTCTAVAHGAAKILLQDSSQAVAVDAAILSARDNSSAVARGRSNVYVLDNAVVVAHNNSRVLISTMTSRVVANDDTTVLVTLDGVEKYSNVKQGVVTFEGIDPQYSSIELYNNARLAINGEIIDPYDGSMPHGERSSQTEQHDSTEPAQEATETQEQVNPIEQTQAEETPETEDDETTGRHGMSDNSLSVQDLMNMSDRAEQEYTTDPAPVTIKSSHESDENTPSSYTEDSPTQAIGEDKPIFDSSSVDSLSLTSEDSVFSEETPAQPEEEETLEEESTSGTSLPRETSGPQDVPAPKGDTGQEQLELRGWNVLIEPSGKEVAFTYGAGPTEVESPQTSKDTSNITPENSSALSSLFDDDDDDDDDELISIPGLN